MRAAVGADHVAPVRVPRDVPHPLAVPELDAGLLRLLDEEGVEPAPLRHVGERPPGIAHEVGAAPEADHRAVDDLLHDRREIEGEEGGGANRHPAAAGFVPREAMALEQQHLVAARGDLARGGAARRAPAHDHDRSLAGQHRGDPMSGPRWSNGAGGPGARHHLPRARRSRRVRPRATDGPAREIGLAAPSRSIRPGVHTSRPRPGGAGRS